MTKTNKIYLTFRNNSTKFVIFCTFLIVLFSFCFLLFTQGNTEIKSIQQKITCQKFLSKQNHQIRVMNHFWLPQLKLIQLSGLNLKNDPNLHSKIHSSSFISRFLNQLQTFVYLDEKQSILVPIYLPAGLEVEINITQENPINNSIDLSIISLYSNKNSKTPRSIFWELDRDYQNIKSQPIPNIDLSDPKKPYQDHNQIKISLEWDYVQYYNISNFMG